MPKAGTITKNGFVCVLSFSDGGTFWIPDMSEKTMTGRQAAVKALGAVNLKKDYAAQILEHFVPYTTETQRAMDIVTGVVRNRAVIDALIEKCSGVSVKRISKQTVNIIRAGVYELTYCPQTPEHAIVNESVEIAKGAGGRKQTGFVNAVLRAVQRHIVNRNTPLAETPMRRILPATPQTGCQFDIDILPDADEDAGEFLAQAFSLPKWLVAGWLRKFGPEACRRACFGSNRRPGLYVRPNTLKTTADELAEIFSGKGLESEVTEAGMIRLTNPHAVTELPGFAEGLFTVQDPTAAKAVRLLEPRKDWKILDLCAAPGTKIAQLAETTGDQAVILATDIDSERLKRVEENVARLALKSVTVFAYDELERLCAEQRPFDCVLLDVPCSNTGVLARRPEVRHRINPQAVAKLVRTQRRLLDSAAELIKADAVICYSTCSIQSAENAELIKAFLDEHPQFACQCELLTLPNAEGFDYDGGYAAILRKA